MNEKEVNEKKEMERIVESVVALLRRNRCEKEKECDELSNFVYNYWNNTNKGGNVGNMILFLHFLFFSWLLLEER